MKSAHSASETLAAELKISLAAVLPSSLTFRLYRLKLFTWKDCLALHRYNFTDLVSRKTCGTAALANFPESTGDSGGSVMGQFRVLLLTSVLCAMTACSSSSHFSAGIGSNNSAAGSQNAGITLVSKNTEPATTATETHTTAALPANKLIALTFDDGPRPYVLFGSKEAAHPAPGLADILDKNGIKATFFVVGWRLTPKTWGEPRHEENIGVTCLDAAQQLIRRGHELEDHTYSH